MPDKRFQLKPLAIAAALAIALPSVAHAGFGSEEFDESDSHQDAELQWPEVEFPSQEERGRGLRSDESFTFRAQWGIFRKAGKIIISTESDTAADEDQSPLLNVKLDTRSDGLIRRFYPLNLVSKTTLDAEKWRVLRDEVDEKVRSKSSRTLALFDYEQSTVDYTDEVEPERNKTAEIPYEVALDYASFILQLRGWEMPIGSRYASCVSTRGKFYYVQMQAMEKESIKTEFGTKTCIRVEPVSVFPESKTFREGGKMAIWFTDDSERVPVRFDVKTSVGTASIRLEDYTLAQPTESLAQR